MGGLNPGPDGWLRGKVIYERAGNRWGGNTSVNLNETRNIYYKSSF